MSAVTPEADIGASDFRYWVQSGPKLGARWSEYLTPPPGSSLRLAARSRRGRRPTFRSIRDPATVSGAWEESTGKSRLKAAAIDDAEVDLFTPNKMLAEILRVSGVRYVDVLPFMREKRDDSFYFYHDGHWARGGHDFAAKIVHHFLSGMLERAQGRGQKTCRFR